MDHKEKLITLMNDNEMSQGQKEKMMQDDDPVNPKHYKSYDPTVKIECIDAMRAAFGVETIAGFCVANAFKYIFRHTSKGKNTDIKKAIWYLNKYLELGGAE